MSRERLVAGDYDYLNLLRSSMSEEMLKRLLRIPDPELHRWVADIISVARPSSVYVNIGSEEDFEYVRRKALLNKEELPTKYPSTALKT
jgi:phosphoenolpyruvate carboxykinase (GTP)